MFDSTIQLKFSLLIKRALGQIPHLLAPGTFTVQLTSILSGMYGSSVFSPLGITVCVSFLVAFGANPINSWLHFTDWNRILKAKFCTMRYWFFVIFTDLQVVPTQTNASSIPDTFQNKSRLVFRDNFHKFRQWRRNRICWSSTTASTYAYYAIHT